MEGMKNDLRQRLINWKLSGRKIEGGYRFYTNEVAADRALAALGLDDFQAAVERGAKALGWDEEMDHEPHGEQLWDEAQAVLEAALSATEGKDDA